MTGWKTVIVGAAIAAVGFLQGVSWVDVIPDDPATQGWVTTGLGVVMLVLRFLTTTPVGKSS